MIYLGVLALLSFLILVHELGHLLAARLVGIPVAEFSIGLGPRLWKRRYGRVVVSLRALPLGGFVAPGLDEYEFSAIPLSKRLAFYLGGPLANLAAALPAFAALNVLERGWSAHQLFVAPFGQLYAACGQFVSLLSGLVTGTEPLRGAVGIVVEGSRAAAAGMALELGLSLSISLALLNLLPIPVLDGGQITMHCLEALFPRVVRLRVPLTLLGMIVLAALTIYANAQDVSRYWL